MEEQFAPILVWFHSGFYFASYDLASRLLFPVSDTYIMLSRACAASLKIELLKSTLERFFTKPEYMARILNEKQFRRLGSLLESHKVARSVVHGGAMDPKTL